MSMLEDIYMQDEAEVDGDLKRIIDGGDDIPEDRNSDAESDRNSHSEAEEEKPRKVDPAAEKKAKVVKNPRFVLNPARLMGPRGIGTIEKFYSDFQFQGKGHEKEDLDVVMKKMEHWAHRLYPKFQFDDCIDKIASLGNKKILQVHMRKIRLNMLFDDEGIVHQQDSDNEDVPAAANVPEMDEFDLLLEQQIALARSTPASNMKNSLNQTITPKFPVNDSFDNLATSVQTPKPPAVGSSPQLTEEQKARMMKNRLLAEERRLARMKANSDKEKQTVETINSSDLQKDLTNENITNVDEIIEDDRIVDDNLSIANDLVKSIVATEPSGSGVEQITNSECVNDDSFVISEENDSQQAIKESNGSKTVIEVDDEMMDVDEITLNLSE